MPACTITSQTAHGGIVTVGYPTVLINFMPASRIGDMHVCPMVTGIVPHVGGPFVLGSPTVLVGMMPQSRVTDQLVCVGPPDIAVMGAETVLVGMAGAGGVMGAMGGIAAMGASVPMQAPPASDSQPKATLQQDGTIQTSAPAGGRLPPITLQQPGWPDLPAKETPNFQSAQPVTIPEGTTIYRVIDDDSNPAGGYWAPDLPADEATWRSDCAVKPEWNSDGKVAVCKVPAGGMKAWMGPASSQGSLGGGGTQLWVPPGTAKPDAIFPSPWSGKGGK
ncbi:PAAR domain-containing protein [Paracidobacterium acidisoli]|uniref:Type VI secretion protein n=1 Tax=Paracidobacterium acidisoli TaxID=2303751 RepID=A0A372ISL9_9BACT|nr:PAAR domain-containing protein [Paracidobacterium acidisoli]MBT9330208.1 PAAR domain-containing protein [Paracidobacterium acidisoli]